MQTTLPHLDDFLLSLETNNYSAETVYNYERDLKIFEDFLGENGLDFNDLNKKAILNYKAYLVSRDRRTAQKQSGQRKLASFSLNRMLSALRSYLRFLTDLDFPSPLAANAVKLIKTEKKKLRISEFEEIKKLIESPSQFEKNKKIALRNRAILETFFSTGLRISELINLKISQIDRQGKIFIRGKGKKERFVYLTNRAQNHIKRYLEVRGSSKSPYLFIPYSGRNVSKKEKKLSPNYLELKVKQYRQALRLAVPLTVHGLRHAFATYLVENGASPAALQIILGHESLDTTTRYVHGSDRYAESSLKKFHPLPD